MKFLAAAIAFAVVVIAFMFRYDYQHAATVRVDRWTGERTEVCQINQGKVFWTPNCVDAHMKEQ